MRARNEFLAWLFLAISTTAPFWLTDLDYRASAWFFAPDNSGQPWPRQYEWPLKLLYDYAFAFTLVAGVLALAVYLGGFFNGQCRRMQRKAMYILLVILVGPGLLVNLVLKDHWGRPRPVHIRQFGGEYAYVPPLKLGHTEDKSFVCGHCSVGYAFFALYFLSQHHKLLYFMLTLMFAGVLGYTRMSAGGHFLSDVLWSGYVMFLVAFALYYGWFARMRPGRRQPEN